LCGFDLKERKKEKYRAWRMIGTGVSELSIRRGRLRWFRVSTTPGSTGNILEFN